MNENTEFRFVKDGYTVLRGRLPAKMVESYEKEILSSAYEGYQAVTGESSVWQPDIGKTRLTCLTRVFTEAGPRAVELSSWLYRKLASGGSSQRLLEAIEPMRLASELLGGDAGMYRLRPESTMTRIDLAGPSPVRLDWHQEVRYDETRSEGIQFWIPLFQNSSWESGSMEIAIGSQAEGILEVELKNEGQSGARQYTVPNSIVSKYNQTIVEISPGDVAVLDCRTIHRSSDPARQKNIKITLIGRCTR